MGQVLVTISSSLQSSRALTAIISDQNKIYKMEVREKERAINECLIICFFFTLSAMLCGSVACPLLALTLCRGCVGGPLPPPPAAVTPPEVGP